MTRRRGTASINGADIRALSPSARTVVDIDADRTLHDEARSLIDERWQHGLGALAESLDIDRDRLANFLAGDCGLSASALINLAQRMRCEASFLLGRRQADAARVLSDDEARQQARAVIPRVAAAVPRPIAATVPESVEMEPETPEPESVEVEAEPTEEPQLEEREPPPPVAKPKPRHPVARRGKSKPKVLTAEQQEARRSYGRRRARELRTRKEKIAREYGCRF